VLSKFTISKASSARLGTGARLSSGTFRPSVLIDLPHPKAPPAVASRLEALERQARQAAWPSMIQVAGEIRSNPAVSGELKVVAGELERRATRLDAWQRLRLLVRGTWERKPDAGTLKRILVEVEASAGKATRDRLARYLACRARLEGEAELASQLHPEGKGQANGAEVLRDLKLSTPPPAAKESVPRPPGDPLLNLPIPEAPALSVRPAVREALGAGLPMLAELEAAEMQAREGVGREAEVNAWLEWHQVRVQMGQLAPYQRGVGGTEGLTRQTALGETVPVGDPLVAEVEKQVGRKLSAAEKVLVRHLRQKRSEAEVVEIVRKLPERRGEGQEGVK
jgi:hypothetical protein